jgi:hypothetical protein
VRRQRDAIQRTVDDPPEIPAPDNRDRRAADEREGLLQ